MNNNQNLPIEACHQQLIEEISKNQVTIIIGETGSGKTTQIPKYILNAKLNGNLKIAVSQPRRVAAISLSTRIASELGQQVGDTVGYAIRFKDVTSKNTKIKFMTDGLMLKEYLSTRFDCYSVIILDEAHERTLRTDLLFGLVKRVLKRRPDLKVIVMSATLDADQFSSYFDGANILYVQGRQFPVRIFHAVTKQTDPIDAALVTILQIHREEKSGDILVFLTGQEEIEACAAVLKDVAKFFPADLDALLVCPIFAALPTEAQQLVFEPTPKGMRKVILSTNIAETSITIPNVVYVIDSGLVKTRDYNSKIGLDSLVVEPISQASALQRTGRAGRERSGSCYRLFTEESFNKMQTVSDPEIKRCNLTSLVLTLKAAGINDCVNFEYMDKPNRSCLVNAMESLFALGALDDKGNLTGQGKLMAVFPIEPHFSRVLISSKLFKCTRQVITILSCLSVDSILSSSSKDRDQVNQVLKTHLNHDGDLLTFMNIIQAFKSLKSNGDNWCKENMIKKRSINQIINIEKQLIDLCNSNDIAICDNDNLDEVLKCFLTGFFMNVAVRQVDGSYKTLISNQSVFIHPSSVLFGSKCEAVMFMELVYTRKKYMRGISAIKMEWLNQVASHYFKKMV